MANEKPILLDLSAIKTIATGVDTHINDICSTEEEVRQIIEEILGQPGEGGNPGGGSAIKFPITVEQGGTGVTTIEEVRKEITGFNDIFTNETTNAINIGTGNYVGTRNADTVMIGNNILPSASWPRETVAIGNNLFTTSSASTSVIVGYNIGSESGISASNSVLIGDNIGGSGSNSSVVAIGHNAIASRKGSISFSVAIGPYAGQTKSEDTSTNTTQFCVLIGGYAGENSVITKTVAIGESAASGNQTISDSIAIGYTAGRANSPGETATSGSVFVGNNAGQRRSFTNCTSIGNETMYWLDNNYTTLIENSTAVGYKAVVTGSNQIQLGSSGTTTYVYGTVQSRSDERDKTNITDLDYNYIKFIDALKPRNFQWDMREDYMPDASDVKTDEDGTILNPAPSLDQIVHDGTHTRKRRHNGFIAQEVKQIMDDMNFDFGGYQDHSVNGGQDVLSLGYEEFIAPMVAYMQDLRKENLIMKTELAAMREQLNQLLQQK